MSRHRDAQVDGPEPRSLNEGITDSSRVARQGSAERVQHVNPKLDITSEIASHNMNMIFGTASRSINMCNDLLTYRHVQQKLFVTGQRHGEHKAQTSLRRLTCNRPVTSCFVSPYTLQ